MSRSAHTSAPAGPPPLTGSGVALLIVMIVATGSCAKHARTLPYGVTTMPSPSGCYVLVSDMDQLAGVREYINGPSKLAALNALPFGSNWHRRIRSMRVGPSAEATIWSAEAFRGQSLRLAPNAERLMFSNSWSGRIESLEIACQPE